MVGSQCQTPLLTGRRAQWLQVGRSGCGVGVGETASAIACRHLFIRASPGTARGYIAPMGVVGGVLAHWVVGILGWEELQLPTGLPATETHNQCQEIDDSQCHHHRYQHQQGNAPARYNGGRRKGGAIRLNFRDFHIISLLCDGGTFFQLLLHIVGMNGTVLEGHNGIDCHRSFPELDKGDAQKTHAAIDL